MDLDGVVCLDLPLNVVDTGKAVDMVGGADEVARVSTNAAFAKDPEPLQLQLRNNRFHHPVRSSVQPSRNIVVEIRLPSGSDVQNVQAGIAAAVVENQPVEVTPKFRVETLYRFRGIADFQYYSGNNAFLQQTDKALFQGNLAEIEKLSFHTDSDLDILPPPLFSTLTQPFYYAYKQTPYLKLVDDGSGNQQVVHTVGSVKMFSNILTWGDVVPDGPPAGLEETPRKAVMDCVNDLKQLFEKRPSYTRRWLLNYLGPIVSRYLKFALPYVAYYYRSGPWRGAYIRYGLDPSVHTELAPFQVEHFRITGEDTKDDEEEEPMVEPHSEYVFDGTKSPNVPMVQLEDIRDGFLEKYIHTPNLRNKVHPTDGWFRDDSTRAIRKVLRAELVGLKESRVLSNTEKQRLVDERD